MEVYSGSSGEDMTFLCKPTITPMKAKVNLWFDGSSILDDPARYRRLIENLIYLTVTTLDIAFVVGVLSRLIHQPKEVHWIAALRILAYAKSSPGKDLLYKKYDHVRIFGYSVMAMLVRRKIENLPLDIAPLLKKILWLEWAKTRCGISIQCRGWI